MHPGRFLFFIRWFSAAGRTPGSRPGSARRRAGPQCRSAKHTAPSAAATKGLSAQNSAAWFAVVPLCATGWSVKPKPLHTSASANTTSHSVPLPGRCGVSNRNDAISASAPRKPTCTTPDSRGSAPACVSRSVTRMAAEYKNASRMQYPTPGASVRPPRSVSSATPSRHASAPNSTRRSGQRRLSAA